MRTHALLTSILTLLAAAPAALSATRTWTGGAPAGPGQHNWSNTQNWAGGVDAESGDTAVFPAGAAYMGAIVQNLGGQFNDLDSVQFQASGYVIDQLVFRVATGISTTFFSGTVTVNAPVKLEGASAFTVSSSRAELVMTSALDLNAKTIMVNGSGVLRFNGGVNGIGNVVKNGTGRLELNGPMPGGGGFSMTAGTVLCNHATMQRPVNMSGTATLGGTGTALNVFASGGTIQPGVNGAGVLNVTGSVAMNASTTLAMEINGSGAGGFTQLAAGSGFTAGNATLDLTFGAGYIPLIGVPIVLVDNKSAAAVSGTFSGLPQDGTLVNGGATFRISYTGGTGNDITLTAVTVAPTGIERVWTGAVDNTWSAPGNWAGNIAPKPGDNVQFPDVVAAKKTNLNTLPPGFALNRVRFTAGGYCVSGSALFLTDGIVQQAPAGSTANVVKFPLTSPATAGKLTTVRLQSGGALNLEPSAAFTQPFAGDVLLLQNDQAGALLTSKAQVAGGGVVAKSGAGPVFLDAASTHTGGIRIYAGELRAEQPDRLGSGLVGIDPPGTLVTGKAGVSFGPFTNAADVAGTIQAMGFVNWSGPVFLQGGLDARFVSAASGVFQLSGAISGDGGVRFEGGDDFLITGFSPNDYSGATLVDEVRVFLQKGDNIIALPGNVTVNNGHLGSSFANQVADTALLEAVNEGGISFSAPDTVSALRMSDGKVEALQPLTVTDSIEAIAAALPSFLEGTFLTGANPVPLTAANGAAQPDLQFTGTLGHAAGSAARFILNGEGTVKVLDGPAVAHPDLEMTLNAGTLEWDDLPAAAIPFGPNVILNGGTLTGTGCVRTVSALTTGKVIPGGTPGILQSNTFALRAGTVFDVDIKGSVPGTGYDQLQVQGAVDPRNAALVLNGTPPEYGQEIIIITNDGSDAVNSTFSTLPEGGQLIMGNALLRITYTGGDGNDVSLTRVAPPAPEEPVINIAGNLSDGALPVTAGGEGIPGFNYVLEVSGDLASWTTASSRAADSNGQISLQWLPSSTAPRRFFRIRAL